MSLRLGRDIYARDSIERGVAAREPVGQRFCVHLQLTGLSADCARRNRRARVLRYLPRLPVTRFPFSDALETHFCFLGINLEQYFSILDLRVISSRVCSLVSFWIGFLLFRVETPCFFPFVIFLLFLSYFLQLFSILLRRYFSSNRFITSESFVLVRALLVLRNYWVVGSLEYLRIHLFHHSSDIYVSRF